MIIEWMAGLGVNIISIIFTMGGVLPDYSPTVISAVDSIFQVMYSGVSLASIFVDFNMVKIMGSLAIAALNFDKIVKLVMYIIKKIPVLDIR